MPKPDRESRSLLQALDKLETLMMMTKNEYEMYFMGVLKRPPAEKLREIKRTIHEFQEMHITNTRVQFKLRVLRTRFNTLSLRWLKTTKQIEEGTYHKHRWLANKREESAGQRKKSKSAEEVRAEIRALMRGEDPEAAAASVRRESGAADVNKTARSAGRKVAAPRTAGSGQSRGHTLGSDSLFDDYMRARRAGGQNGSVNRAALEATLGKHREAIKAKYGVKDVRFKVVTENGRPKVKAVPVK